MSTKAAGYAGYFSPLELQKIESVIRDVCDEAEGYSLAGSALIAGEAIKMYQNGVSDFNVMRNRLRMISSFKRAV